jgi:ATP-binding cassette subfamily B protein
MAGSRRPPIEDPPKPSWRSRVRDTFAHAPRTLRLVGKSSGAGTIALALLTVGAAIVPLGIAWVGKAIMDAVVARSADATLRWVLVELGLVALQALLQRALALVKSLLGARLAIDINVEILKKALRLDLRYFEDPEFYDKLTRARREASSRPLSVVTQTFTLAQNLITLAGYAALLVRFSGLAVVGLVLAAIPATIVEMKFSATAFRLKNWRSPESRRMSYLEYVLANDGHAKEVKLFGIGPELLTRYESLGETFYAEDKRLSTRRAVWAWTLSLLATGAFYAAYAAMAIEAARGALTLGNMVLYVMAFRQGQQAFQSILSAIGGMYEDNLYMSNLFSYFAEAETAITSPTPTPTLTPTPTPAVTREAGIRFEGVGFRYPGKEAWALRGLDLFVPRGQSLALVGHNGAGKTTFIKLLTRLYEPTEGRILLDGKELGAWDPEELRRRIGVVFQDYNRYQLKARDNVGLGSVDHLDDEPRLVRATERGGATDVVASLKEGIDTQLGSWFKDGVELSGGQWQKVALARAFMREEADILVLDEPTAALDAEAEHAVFERFKQLAEGRTSILISHRFPTVRMADNIVVLEGGHLQEQGSHEELVAKGGRYAQLFALQARGYL